MFRFRILSFRLLGSLESTRPRPFPVSYDPPQVRERKENVILAVQVQMNSPVSVGGSRKANSALLSGRPILQRIPDQDRAGRVQLKFPHQRGGHFPLAPKGG
ncbi:MAG: hypothetical protein H6Q42_2562, partial [Deltaproteobacteria bacterium]|nr:hypothetical protein [Deltaproteobacteria bacterium]